MALTFNKKSWHYRAWNFQKGTFESKPKSLCPYFRGVAFGVFLFTLMVFTILFIVSSSIANLLYLTDSLLGLWPESLYVDGGLLEGLLKVGAAVNISALILGLFGAIAYVREKVKEARWEREEAEYNRRYDAGEEITIKKQEPSLVVAWLRAVHGKFCPSIEFE